jgi:hypothetical protein
MVMWLEVFLTGTATGVVLTVGVILALAVHIDKKGW